MRTLLKLIACLVFAASGPSFGDVYYFYGLSNNNAVNTATGTSQLSVDVTDPGGDYNVLFTFNNAGPNESSITAIYFDDGTLLASSTITNGTGVSFSQGASPGNLPAGNEASPPFDVTFGFDFDSNPPAQPNGVNPGESVSILFTLQNSQEYATVLAGLGTGALRIGIHVQGFADGGSESFITPIPEPEIYAMMLVGLGLMGFVAKRRRQTYAAAA